jgi:hypothetical protein
MPRTTMAAATIVPTTRSERDVLRVISKIPPSENAKTSSGRDVRSPDVPSKGDIGG